MIRRLWSRTGQRDSLRHRLTLGADDGRHDGRRLRRPAADRRARAPGRAGRRRGRRVALHGGRPTGRWARVSSASCRARRGGPSTGSRAWARVTRPTRTRRTTPTSCAAVGIESQRRLRDRARAHGQGAAATGSPSPRSRRSGSTGRSANRISRCPSGYRSTFVGTSTPTGAPSPCPRRRRPPTSPMRRETTMAKVLVTGSAGFIGGYIVEELLHGRPRGRRRRQLLQVRPRQEVLRRPPQLQALRRRRREGRPHGRALLRTWTTSSRAPRSSAGSPTSTPTPTTCSRRTSASSPPRATPPSRRTTAARGGSRRSPTCRPRWSSSQRLTGPRRRATSARSRRRCRPTASRSSPSSTSPAPRGTSTSCPYTILRPFNCVGIGESRALGDVEIDSGNVKLAMSHVVPDLVQKVFKGQDPLHILGSGEQIRHYTYGGDLARGIVMSLEPPRRDQQRLQPLDAERSLRDGAGRDDLAQDQGPRRPSDLWRTTRASSTTCSVGSPTPEGQGRARLRGDDHQLEDMLDEVIPWIEAAMADGRI